MSAMDDVFGSNPARPEHPDFWRISQVILHNDGAIDDAPTSEAKNTAWRAMVDPVVDLDSLMFMAEQRVRRIFGPIRTGSTEELNARGKLVTLCLDAFITGAMYEAAGGHREATDG